MRTIRAFATAVAIPVLLTACSSGGSDSGGSGFTGGGETFFNDTDGIKFADALGGSFSDVFAAVFGGLNSGSSTASDSSISQRMKRISQTDTQQCDSGGTIAVSTNTNDATNEINSIGMTFNNCVTDGNRANGGISMTLSGTPANQTVTLSFNNFNAVENGERSSLNGAVTINAVESGSQTSTTISGTSITMVSAGETVTISNYNLNSDTDNITDAASISGAATIATTSDGTIVMAISPALSTTGDSDYPTTGTIGWTHSDGSSLEIDADTGDATTFSYVISDGASTTSGVGKWSETDIGEITF